MGARHTPGPYEAHTDGGSWWVQTPAPERAVIATGLTEPHARLIAAAPDLLTAVIELVAEQIKLGPFDEPLGSSEQTPAVNLGLAVLAKARGEQP